MAINFPDSPTISDSFTSGDRTWVWNGTTWKSTHGGLSATSPIQVSDLNISFDSTSIEANSADIQVNSDAIIVNSADIQSNSDAIVVNSSDIQSNSDAIAANSDAIELSASNFTNTLMMMGA
jgi:hypothetical protein